MKKERPRGKDMFQGKSLPTIDPDQISVMDPILGEMLRRNQNQNDPIMVAVAAIGREERENLKKIFGA